MLRKIDGLQKDEDGRKIRWVNL